MQTSVSNLNPVTQLERIQALDVMRGIVLCGILLMNINGFGLAESYSDPTVAGGAEGLNLTTWIVTNMFFEGTMRALFSLLFGIGMYILLERLEKRNAGIMAADIYFRRLLWLLVFGIIHAYIFLWGGEILFNYSLMGFLIYSFRNMASKYLVIFAIGLFSVGLLWNYCDYKAADKMVNLVEEAGVLKAQGMELTKEMKDADKKWDEIVEKRSAENIKFHNENMHKGYFQVAAFIAPFTMHWKMYGFYRYDAWDVLPMMLLGIALFKWNIMSAGKSYWYYLIMALLGYAIGLTINYFETQYIINQNFSYLSFQKTNITYDLGRVPVAMGHIGMIMLLCKLPFLHWLKLSLASIGKMALTNYFMHSLICMFVFTGVGFSMFGKMQRFELLYVVFSIWIFQMILSPIWLSYFHFGPVEWLWRRLSYLHKPAFRK